MDLWEDIYFIISASIGCFQKKSYNKRLFESAVGRQIRSKYFDANSELKRCIFFFILYYKVFLKSQ